jgi:queuosine precursor transporter
MNEIVFFLHVFAVVFFLLASLRLGKEALIVCISLQAVLANLFVVKQTELFGFEVTCSDVYAIGSMLGLNLLQEFFGRDWVKKTISICFGAIVLFGIMSQIHLLYEPSAHDTKHQAFAMILTLTPRIIIASVTSYWIVQQMDMRLYGFLKTRWQALSIVWRTTIALILSQLLDTALFSFLALYGIVESVWEVMLLGFTVKSIIIFCSTPFTALSKRFLPKPHELT